MSKDNTGNISTRNERILLLEEMEKEFDSKNIKYFEKLLSHNDHIIRTRAVCILAEIAIEDAVTPISSVLKEDDDELVRHEAAFSLGQLGYNSAIDALSLAVKNDPSFFVRHEAAIALGVIGSEMARGILNQALEDPHEEVRKSADVAIANLDYINHVKRINKFTKLTGG